MYVNYMKRKDNRKSHRKGDNTASNMPLGAITPSQSGFKIRPNQLRCTINPLNINLLMHNHACLVVPVK